MTAAAGVHGRLAQLTLGTNDVSPYCTKITFKRQNDTHDITGFGLTSHAYLAGLIDGEMTVDGMFDATATVGSQTNFNGMVGDSDGVAFVYGPAGSVTGKVKYSGQVILSDYTESTPVADIVTFTATMKISGAVTTGVYP